MVSGPKHAFLKLKNIELPMADGQKIKGNTILDPTWNMTEQAYGARPSNFCVSYEQIRKNDIDNNGKDQECHLNDEKLQDATLGLDDKSLRDLYRSVGLANKDGRFPISSLMNTSNDIDAIYAKDPEGNVNAQLLCLQKYYPDFAKRQNSTINILRDVFLNHENIGYNECIINRVYNKEDNEKRPTFYVYIDYSDEIGKKFYVANKDEGKFDEYGLEEFEKQFECYQKDLDKLNGIRPWRSKQKETEIDLSRSSGNIIGTENVSAKDTRADQEL